MFSNFRGLGLLLPLAVLFLGNPWGRALGVLFPAFPGWGVLLALIG